MVSENLSLWTNTVLRLNSQTPVACLNFVLYRSPCPYCHHMVTKLTRKLPTQTRSTRSHATSTPLFPLRQRSNTSKGISVTLCLFFTVDLRRDPLISNIGQISRLWIDGTFVILWLSQRYYCQSLEHVASWVSTAWLRQDVYFSDPEANVRRTEGVCSCDRQHEKSCCFHTSFFLYMCPNRRLRIHWFLLKYQIPNFFPNLSLLFDFNTPLKP